MVPKKAKSKRQSLSDKFKIERRCREHTRKMKKAARGATKRNGKKALKKDPGLPNLWPFKENFVRQMEKKRAHEVEMKEKQKQERKLLKQHSKTAGDSLDNYMQDVASKNDEFERKEQLVGDKGDGVNELNTWKDNSKRSYYRELKKVITKADVILQVLDARDPLGCRCTQMEQMINSAQGNKKIVLVLNKIDLVPKDIVEKWLKYLRNMYPTIAFKASTQSQRQNLKQSKISTEKATEDLLAASESLGVDTLVKLLKNYSRSADLKKTITVGIVGYPNVGKSSIINSLKRSKTCTVGSTPGVTKAAQEIHLDKNVKLLDSPGIVFASDNKDSDVILRNCVNIDNLPDPTEPVGIILERCNKQQLMEMYRLPNFNNSHEFLVALARTRGHLKKGGVVDLDSTARQVLRDWNTGNIPFYTHPPQLSTESRGQSTVVNNFSKAFDIGGLLGMDEQKMLDALSAKQNSSNFISMLPSVGTEMPVDGGMSDDDEEQEENTNGDMERDNGYRLTQAQIQKQNKKNKGKNNNNDNDRTGGDNFYSFDNDFVELDDEDVEMN